MITASKTKNKKMRKKKKQTTDYLAKYLQRKSCDIFQKYAILFLKVVQRSNDTNAIDSDSEELHLVLC